MGILDLFRLKGKNALVTGSAQGLGAGIAIALARAGANVTLHGYDRVLPQIEEAVRQTGVRSISLIGDVCDPAVCRRLVDETEAAFGSIDIVVNNAGTILRASAAEHPAEYWNTVIETNLSSVFRISQYAGRKMLAQGAGKIINIASMQCFQGGILIPSYTASKGGVGQLTKALANEWAAKGVNVNAIAPGYMATDNTAALIADPVRSKSILARIPAGRWGESGSPFPTPDPALEKSDFPWQKVASRPVSPGEPIGAPLQPSDLGGAAVFLASAASNYVHGHLLVVDGGWLSR